MKNHSRVQHKRSGPAQFRVKQMHSHSSRLWMLIAAICFVTFIGMVGVANAAQTSGGSQALARKEQYNQQLLSASRTHMRAKPSKQQAQEQMSSAESAPSTPARQAGITTMRQGPFPLATLSVQNLWQGPVGNDWVLAYAGAKMQSNGTAGQGGIVLYTETINNHGGFDLHPLGTFLAPSGTTALTSTTIKGDLLLLTSTTGQQVTFNLTSHQFK